MMKKILFAALVLAGVFLAPPTLYVSPTGSGTACTIAAPCTLTEAIRQGGEIIMRGGTYNAPTTGWQFTKPSTLANYPGEVVTLTSKNKVSGNYIIKCLQSSPAVNDVKIIGSDVGASKGIIMTGEFLGIAPAIVAYQCDNWEIAGIEFRDVAYAIFQRKVNHGATSADRWYVHDNLVSDYYRESGMQFNGNGNRIENNRIVKQTANSSTTYGCQLLNLLGNNNIVRGNYLERVNQSVRCIGIFFEWDLADANLIENNTIKGVPNGISFFGGDSNIIRGNTISGVDTAFVIRSWAENVTAYPCNFTDIMPLESDTNNPDWIYLYPIDCRSKNNRFENNTVSGFSRFSLIDLPEGSNIFVTGTTPTNTATPTRTPTATPTRTITATPTKTITPTIVPPADTRMLIPLYTNPSNWGQVVNANIGNVIDVIINPNNGVGASRQTAFVNGISMLRSDDVSVFGYIATTYGARSISAVKAEVDTWQLWYAPDGIFLDEVSNTNDPVKLAYYGELYSYIKSKGLTVIHNPGGSTVEAYTSVSDVSCVYETVPVSPLPYPAWGAPSKLCALSFNASREQMISFVAETKGRFRYIYATSDTLGNPWDVLPGYLAEQAALIAGLPTITPTITVPPSQTMTATATTPDPRCDPDYLPGICIYKP